MIKVARFIQLLTVIFFLVVLVIGYAYLPSTVQLLPYSQEILLPKDTYFYLVGGIFLGLHVLLSVLMNYTVARVEELTNETVAAWWRTLPVAINTYLILLIGFIAVFNNSISIPAANYAYLNYMGPAVLIIWILGFAISFLITKRSNSPSIG